MVGFSDSFPITARGEGAEGKLVVPSYGLVRRTDYGHIHALYMLSACRESESGTGAMAFNPTSVWGIKYLACRCMDNSFIFHKRTSGGLKNTESELPLPQESQWILHFPTSELISSGFPFSRVLLEGSKKTNGPMTRGKTLPFERG